MSTHAEDKNLEEVYALLAGAPVSDDGREMARSDSTGPSDSSESTPRDVRDERLGRAALRQVGARAELIENCPPTHLNLIGEPSSKDERESRARELLEILRRRRSDGGQSRGSGSESSRPKLFERDPEHVLTEGREGYDSSRLAEVYETLVGY